MLIQKESSPVIVEADGGGQIRITHPQRIYFERIEQHLLPGMNWLDVGCGRKLVYHWLPDAEELEAKLKAKPARLVGIDPDLAALRDNVSLTDLLLAGAEALPFADDSFELVTSNMVFEHIAHPLPVLRELNRVMCPGARLIIFTPNVWDFVSIAARIIPNRLHPRLVSWFEGRNAADVYPTQFKFNHPPEIRGQLSQTGFRTLSIEYLEHHDIFGHHPFIGRMEQLWHRLAHRFPVLRGTLLIEAEAV